MTNDNTAHAGLEAWATPCDAPTDATTTTDDRRGWRLVSIADIGPAQEPDWIWPGYLARGSITLFTGLWKAGKTTLLGHLLRDLDRGAGLVDHRIDAPVLVCSEEAPGVWARRRESLRLPPSVHLVIRDGFARPTKQQWELMVSQLAETARSLDAGLVVFDTLPSLWPVANENDASEVLEALAPLRAITDAGAALLLVHHPRKGGGTEGQATRGSGSLPGFVDIILELRRNAPTDAADTRRVLTAMGRFDSTDPERVVELGEGGYTMLGPRAQTRQADTESTILGLLAQLDRPTCDEILAEWPTEVTPGRTSFRSILRAGADRGAWQMTGSGVKGDPYRFEVGAGRRA